MSWRKVRDIGHFYVGLKTLCGMHAPMGEPAHDRWCTECYSRLGCQPCCGHFVRARRGRYLGQGMSQANCDNCGAILITFEGRYHCESIVLNNPKHDEDYYPWVSYSE